MGKASGSQNFHPGWFQCWRWTLHLQINHSEKCRDMTEHHKHVSHRASSPPHQPLLQCLLLQVQVLPPLPHTAHSGGCGCCQSNWSEECVQQSPSGLYLGKWDRETSAPPQPSSSSLSFQKIACTFYDPFAGKMLLPQASPWAQDFFSYWVTVNKSTDNPLSFRKIWRARRTLRVQSSSEVLWSTSQWGQVYEFNYQTFIPVT